MKSKKYPKIEPKIRKNKAGKPAEVYLDLNVYSSIYEEMHDLEKRISELNKKIGHRKTK